MQFGVIGCGRISQIMHLPHLDELPEAEIVAIADPAANVRREMGEKYRVDDRFADGVALVEEMADRLDAVVIATPPLAHREVAEAALDRDIHVFCEKPLALTVEDCDALVAAVDDSEAIAMVGYMKRHDPTYLRMQELVREADVQRAAGTLVLGQHDETIDEIYDLVEADLDQEFLEESGRKWSEQIEQAIGTDDPDLQQYYSSHLGASCHDLSALRGLFGDIESIDHVDIHDDLQVLDAYLRFEDGTRCMFTSSFNDRREWEEFIRVETPEETLTLEFTNPYVKNDPFTLHRKHGMGHMADDFRHESYEESFKCEMEHFIECIRTGADVRTTFQEGRDDVACFVEFFDHHLESR